MEPALEQAITAASRGFVQRLDALDANPYAREAIMTMAIRKVAWAMLATFNNRDELAYQLGSTGDLIRHPQPDDDRDD